MWCVGYVVRVEYEVGGYWCGKDLHWQSKHLVTNSFLNASSSPFTDAASKESVCANDIVWMPTGADLWAKFKGLMIASRALRGEACLVFFHGDLIATVGISGNCELLDYCGLNWVFNDF